VLPFSREGHNGLAFPYLITISLTGELTKSDLVFSVNPSFSAIRFILVPNWGDGCEGTIYITCKVSAKASL